MLILFVIICLISSITTFLFYYLDDWIKIKKGKWAYKANIRGQLEKEDIHHAEVQGKNTVVIYLADNTQLTFFSMKKPTELVDRINHFANTSCER